MRSTWPLGRVAGITVQVHWTFLILLTWVAVTQGIGGGLTAAGRSALFLTLFFATIALHELGHALAARRFGVRTLDITLLPFGGVARLERFPDGALEGFVIALAGPAVSAGIAVALLGGAWLLGGRELVTPQEASPLLVQLGWANLVLFLFNLLPAYPMDGGRALRAALVPWLGPLGATRRAASIGRGMAALFGLVGALTNPMLVVVAIFVWMQATAEEQDAVVRDALSGRTVADALIRDVRVVPAHARVGDTAQLLLHGLQQDFPVVAGDHLVGVVRQDDLVDALAAGRRDVVVLDVMRRDVSPLELDTPLAAAHEHLRALRQRVAPVVQDGRLVGLVGVDTIAGLLAIETATPAPERQPVVAA